MSEYYLYWERSDPDWNTIEKGNFLLEVKEDEDFLIEIEEWRQAMAEPRDTELSHFLVVNCSKI